MLISDLNVLVAYEMQNMVVKFGSTLATVQFNVICNTIHWPTKYVDAPTVLYTVEFLLYSFAMNIDEMIVTVKTFQSF